MAGSVAHLKRKVKQQRQKQGRKAKLETELGMKIEVSKSHSEAERVAQLKEAIEDDNQALRRATDKLLEQMREEKISTLSAKGPKGTLYDFEVVNTGEKIKITKPKATA